MYEIVLLPPQRHIPSLPASSSPNIERIRLLCPPPPTSFILPHLSLAPFARRARPRQPDAGEEAELPEEGRHGGDDGDGGHGAPAQRVEEEGGAHALDEAGVVEDVADGRGRQRVPPDAHRLFFSLVVGARARRGAQGEEVVEREH